MPQRKRYFSLIYSPRNDETVCDMIWFDGMTKERLA